MKFRRHRKPRASWSSRRVGFEPLECRRLLSFSQNPDNVYDVNSDHLVTPLDALMIVNRLDDDGLGAPSNSAGSFYPDVDGDSQVSPLDALLVINQLQAAALSANTVTPLNALSAISSTADKPQAKVWQHEGQWWTVLSSLAGGAVLYRLDGATWTNVLGLSAGVSRADVLDTGNVTHVLLASGAASKLVSLEFVPGAVPTYQPWTTRPTATAIDLTDAETATLAVDTTGRMWIASDTPTTIDVRYADAPYSSFSPPFTLASGVAATDISAVTAIAGGKIGVMWSNQSTQRFGFRVHQDGAAPDAWSADELPGGAGAVNDGTGLASNNVNLATASDGTVYATVKTGYITAPLPSLAMLVRRPNGAWDPIYPIDAAGNRGIAVVNEAADQLIVAYRATAYRGPIMYRQSDRSTIAFGGPISLIPSTLVADATSTHQMFNGELIVLAASINAVLSARLTMNVPPTVSAGPDQLIGAPATATLAGLAADSDGPVPLTTTWSKVSGPGDVAFADASAEQTTAQFSEQGVYELRLSAADGDYVRSDTLTVTVDTSLPTAQITSVAPDPRSAPVDAVTIVFSEPVTGADLSDLSLTRDGGANLLTAAQSLTTANNVTYTLGGLSGLTNSTGSYALALHAAGSGIADAAGNLLAGDAGDSFAVDVTAPTADVTDVTPDPRNLSVAQIVIAFSEPVVGFNLAGLRLERDGNGNLLDGSQALTTSDNVHFTLENLSGLTATTGSYVVTLSAANSGVADLSGNPLASDATDGFIVDATAPTADVADVTPDPRNTPVGEIVIVMSEVVSGLDLADLSLTRGGGANLLTAAQSLTTSDNIRYTLGNLSPLTGGDGAYELTVAAAGSGIIDSAGNALTASASDSFTVSVSVTYDVFPLGTMTLGATTGEKPQSKVWRHDGKWWSVLANSSGTSVFRLDGANWTSVLSLSSSKFRADVKPVGDGTVTHVLLYNGTSSKLASIEYVPGGAGSYKLWTVRKSLSSISLSSGVETATIDIDSTGRMWVASDKATDIEVRSSVSPYSTFSSAFKVASGVNSDDISTVVALPSNQIGVLWSDQTTKRFGFRLHNDSASTSTWLTPEIPAAQSAQNLGGGMADDHVNVAVAADGTLYAAVRTSFNTAGQTTIGLLVRRPNGTWDAMYQVDTVGTNPMVELNEQTGKVLVVYGETNTGGPIVYRESPTSNIQFGQKRTLMSNSALNNPTGMKGNFTDQLVVLASTSNSLAGVLLGVNAAPTVNAGLDQTVFVTNPAALDGTVTDDAMPIPTNLTTQWSKISGPGTVTFANAAAVDTTATFGATGQYVLRLTANDGAAIVSDDVTVTVIIPNLAPVVSAGPDQTILFGDIATLDGSATDDGIPATPGVTTHWSVISGPGQVTFGDASATDTTTAFDLRGHYVLRLEATDAVLTSSDDIMIYVTLPNAAPTANGGPDHLAATGAPVSLLGAASDDGEPIEPGVLSVTWTKLSGPGTVTFGNAAAAQTTATVSVPGRYVLQITANDGEKSATDDVIVDAFNPQLPIDRSYQNGTLPTPDYMGADDTKLRMERPTNNYGIATTLDSDGQPPIYALLRWNLGEIPAGSTIDAARIVLNVVGASNTTFDVFALLRDWSESETTWTEAAVGSPWGAAGAQGAADRGTVSLGTLVQPALGDAELVLNAAGRAVVQGWINNSASNHGFILMTTTAADAVTFNASEGLLPELGPKLIVNWRMPGAPPPNSPPTVNAGADVVGSLQIGATLDATVSDDGLPVPPGALTYQWSKISGPGTASFANSHNVDTTATFTLAGLYVLRLTVSDGQQSAFDEVTVQVDDLTVPLNMSFQEGVFPTPTYAGTRDTKLRFENPTQNYMSSTVLEMDGSPDFATLVGWDLTAIPVGSTVRSATLTFSVSAASLDSYEIYALKRNWVESEVTWQQAAVGTNWSVAGADGATDRDTTVLGAITAPVLGKYLVQLGPAGLAVVQSWINNPSANFGLVIQDYLSATDAMNIDSSELLTPDLRPRIDVTYLQPGAPIPNSPPLVNAGLDGSVGLNQSAALDGTVSDDGLPANPGKVTTLWKKVSGPGTVSFASKSSVDTTATFSLIGTYVLRLEATDGALTIGDEVTINVVDLSVPLSTSFQDGVLPTPSYAGTRDTKMRFENPTQNYMNSTVLEVDGSPDFGMLVGWDLTAIPTGSSVQAVTLTFNVAAASLDSYEIYALKRNWVEAETTWNDASIGVPWSVAGADGAADRGSAVLGSITASALGLYSVQLNAAGIAAVQGWINSPASNFGLAIQDYIAASDALTINSRELLLTPELRPRIDVTYLRPGAPPVNHAPTVNAGTDASVSLALSAALNGTVTDDGLPANPGRVTTQWKTVSGPGTVTFGNAAAIDTTARFSLPGTYVLRLEATDGALTTTDEVTLTVIDLSAPISTSFQDGVLPTPSYAGTRDTKMRFENPTQNYKSSTMLDVDGEPDFGALFGWDLTAIPMGSTVTGVSLTFNVAAVSLDTYEFYALKRNWVEAETTWNDASIGVPWSTPGADGAADRGTTVLGTITAPALGPQTVTLNAAGVAAVQGWINNPATNFGLILQDYLAAADALAINSRELLTPELRPKITVSYMQGLPAAAAAGPAAANLVALDDAVLHAAAADEVTVQDDDLSIPVSRAYQDGVLPTPEYAGTRDAKIRFEKPTTNYKTATTLDVDGSPDYATLLVWDISDIPAGSTVQSATLTFNVTGASAQDYEIYRLLRNWTENGVTWNEAVAGTPWQTAGATGTADRGSDVLGALTASAIGPLTVVLGPAGVAAVQSWIDNPANNFGLIIQDYVAAHDALTINSSETTTPSLRPRIDVTYLRPGAPIPNEAPLVDAGAGGEIVLTDAAALDGTVTDDGLPATPGAVTTQWQKVSGPGDVTFGDASAVDTTATFSQGGTYVLKLEANDGELSASDEVTIAVDDLSIPVSLSFQDGVLPTPAYAGTRDTKIRAESPTSNYRNSTLLDVDGSPDFGALVAWDLSAVPIGSTVQAITLTFNVAATSLDTYEIYALNRNWVEAEATWNQASLGSAWSVAGADGAADRGTTVLGTIAPPTLGQLAVALNAAGVAAVQAWIDNPASNFGLIIQDYVAASDALTINSSEITSLGLRPRIDVSYLRPGAPIPNTAPVVDAGAGATIDLAQSATLDGTVIDDGLPATPGAVTTLWTKVSGTGDVAFANASVVDTTATFTLPGTYVLRLTADDGELSASDEVTVVVEGSTPPVVTIQAENFHVRDNSSDHAWWIVNSESTGVGTLAAATGPYLQSLTDAAQDSGKVNTAPAAPYVEYEVWVSPSAVYALDLFSAGVNTSGDSVWVQVPTGTLVNAESNPTGSAASLGLATGVPQFNWRNAGQWELTEGRHTIRVSMRESGAALDALRLERLTPASPAAANLVALHDAVFGLAPEDLWPEAPNKQRRR